MGKRGAAGRHRRARERRQRKRAFVIGNMAGYYDGFSFKGRAGKFFKRGLRQGKRDFRLGL